MPGVGLDFVETVVSVTTGEIVEWQVVEGMRPALMFGESMVAMVAVREHPDWQAAMRRRGITDFERVQLDPWPAGNFGLPLEAGRRISRVLSYLRESQTDNGYAPDRGRPRLLRHERGQGDRGRRLRPVPLPPERSSYLPEDVGALRTDLRPIEITQPEGPSFTVEGNLVKWQRWSLRIGFDPYEGLTLHTVGYEDGGTVRPILYRASVSEMVVPYGHPGPMHNWKNAFDAGEWGLGRMTQSLTLGCDCLGEIHYFDALLSNEQAQPYTIANAICMHEEDYGILWKHVDLHGGTSEVRRSPARRQLDRDGRQLRVRLLLVLLPRRLDPVRGEAHRRDLADGRRTRREARVRGARRARRRGPNHQHLFNVRLDFDIDGVANTVYECDAEPRSRPGPRTRSATRGARSRRASTPSSRRSATSTRRAAGSGRS